MPLARKSCIVRILFFSLEKVMEERYDDTSIYERENSVVLVADTMLRSIEGTQ
jgi:deoxycytidine triphosphate deaminase